MSLIRSTSNTEGIYIIDQGDCIEIMKGCEEHYKIPYSIFINLIRKYILDEGCKEDYKYRGASLKFYVDDGTCLWHMKYKDIDFSFSSVVLEYIVNGQPWMFCNKKEFLTYHRAFIFKESLWNKK
jgi:hypothetical protein